MPVSGKDKAKDWQLEILMEKLRSKAGQFKSLPEISKNVRMTLLVWVFVIFLNEAYYFSLGKTLCIR